MPEPVDTTRVSDGLVDRIKTLPEVRSVFVDGGRQLPGKKEVRLATFTINLTPKNARHRTQKEVDVAIGALLRQEPDIRSWALRESGQRDLTLITLTLSVYEYRSTRYLARRPALISP